MGGSDVETGLEDGGEIRIADRKRRGREDAKKGVEGGCGIEIAD